MPAKPTSSPGLSTYASALHRLLSLADFERMAGRRDPLPKYDLGRIEESIADATIAIELEPSDVELLGRAYVNRALDLAILGRLEEADADFDKACELGLADAC